MRKISGETIWRKFNKESILNHYKLDEFREDDNVMDLISINIHKGYKKLTAKQRPRPYCINTEKRRIDYG